MEEMSPLPVERAVFFVLALSNGLHCALVHAARAGTRRRESFRLTLELAGPWSRGLRDVGYRVLTLVAGVVTLLGMLSLLLASEYALFFMGGLVAALSWFWVALR